MLIGLTNHDVYLGGNPGWSYAFGTRAPSYRLAVVATARMDPTSYAELADPELLLLRTRKMVTKNIGILHYGLTVSRDPGSVLFTPLSPQDLDAMGEDLPAGAAERNA